MEKCGIMWNPYGIMWNQYGMIWNPYGMNMETYTKMAGLSAKNIPYRIHGIHMELASIPPGIRLECGGTVETSLNGLVYYVISKLNRDIPSRGSEEERIRMHPQVWANIQNRRYKE